MSDKSGVSASVIPLPQGGGALQGMGETFTADEFSGSGNFAVPLTIPDGRNGLQPDLTLSYSSAAGNGPFGLGWTLSAGDVTRRTATGVPRYRDDADPSDADVFVISGGDDLVPVGDDDYRPRTEGAFARIRRTRTPDDDVWRVAGTDGLVSVYGTPGARGDDPATVADPADRTRVYRWALSQTRDPFGNRVRYRHRRDTGDDGTHAWDQLYLDRIEYVDHDDGGAERFLVSIAFAYDERPDPFSTYRAGFEVRTRLRCRRIEVRTHATAARLVRTYELDYVDDLVAAGERPAAQLPANGVSLLARVRVVGRDGDETQQLPPLEFGYTPFDPGGNAPQPVQGVDGALPRRSLADDDLELVDLFGNGLPDIVQMNGTARFWRNLGGGVFDRPDVMPEIPAGVHLDDPGVRFADLSGNGRADLLVTDLGGYFPLSFAGRWSREGFVAYEHAPAAALQAPEARLVDIDGDGVVDALHTGDRFTAFLNEPRSGWGRTVTVPRRPADEFPDVTFVDPRVKLADMSGDGLTDIVLVDRGRVDWWPNLGHGRWGRRVTMAASPQIDDPLAPGLAFDPARLLLGDVDGDGAADVVYVEHGRVTIWINRGGNGFAPPRTVEGTPPLHAPDATRLVDLHGVGTSGLLWTADRTGTDVDHYHFLDLTDATKPYLLHAMDNNRGAVTRVTHAPSSAAYLADERAPATRWHTPLPFPVQVVERVERHDQLSGGTTTTTYRYHHGYWDGAEREFRGFGRVDRSDAERFARPPDGAPGDGGRRADERFASPPTTTRTWFHLGPVGDEAGPREAADLRGEHWPDDPPMLGSDPVTDALLAALGDRDRADALRALRGSVLRTEVYADDDGTPLADRPFVVTETLHGLREEAPPEPASTRRRVFFPHVVRRRATTWERGDDPMTRWSMIGDHDPFGQPRTETQIACPRGWRRPEDRPGRAYLATTTRTTYATPADPDVHIVDRAASVTTHQIRNDGTQRALDLADVPVGDAALEIVNQTVHHYDGDAFAGRPLGEVGQHGALMRSETLVLTEAVLRAAYADADGAGPDLPPYLVPDGAPSPMTDYPAEFLDRLPPLAGYTFHHGDAVRTRGWWATTASHRYDVHELDRASRGLVTATRDPLGHMTTVAHRFDLLPTTLADPAGLVTRAVYDERVLRPREVTDVNGNRTRVAYTPLGLVAHTAAMGADGEDVGDTDAVPGTRFAYDLLAFAESTGDARQPVSVRTIRREHHAADRDVDPAERDATITTVEYSDGDGRLLQTRTQAEDTLFGDPTFGGGVLPDDRDAPAGPVIGRRRGPQDPVNVVVSGATTYDHKGRPVERFEPYFARGFAFAPPDARQRGTKVTMTRDALGRVVRTRHPDGAEQRVVHGVPGTVDAPDVADPTVHEPTPWETYTYDPNDLAPLSVPADAAGESLADRVPATHHLTPSSMEVDALGRTVATVERTGPDGADRLVTRATYDIGGNVTSVTDALGREAFRYVHDLTDAPLRVAGIDAGVRHVVRDAAGAEVERRDSAGALVLHAHDVLGRATHVWARDDRDAAVTLREHLAYGDDGDPAQDPAVRAANRAVNRLGALRAHHDEAGRVVVERYDFKGNTQEQVRHVVADDVVLSDPAWRMDWTPLPGGTVDAHAATLLEPDGYRVSTTYDGFDRVRTLRCPTDVAGGRRVVRPTYNRAGAVERLLLDDEVVVAHVAYDAARRRTLEVLGDAVMTRYAYDPRTTLPTRVRSERVGHADRDAPAFAGTGPPLQDVAYTHDLVGNVTAIADRTPGSGVPATAAGTDALDRAFTYDPLYRLVSATGRECDRPPDRPPWDDRPRCADVTRARAYAEHYTYDAVGNMLRLRHRTADGGFTRRYDLADGTDRVAAMTGSGARTPYVYDARGNLTRESASRHFTWDHDDRLVAFDVRPPGGGRPSVHARYLYGADGQRVKKVVARQAGGVASTVDIDGIFEHDRWQTGRGETAQTDHVHVADGRRVAQVRVGPAGPDDRGPAFRYLLGDHLDSTSLVVDRAGAVLARAEHTPYGETSFGGAAMPRYRFMGRRRDEEHRLSHHGARYYAPWLARWTGCDPVTIADIARDPLHSPYVAFAANPSTYGDDDGESPKRKAKRKANMKRERKKRRDDKHAARARRTPKPKKSSNWRKTFGGRLRRGARSKTGQVVTGLLQLFSQELPESTATDDAIDHLDKQYKEIVEPEFKLKAREAWRRHKLNLKNLAKWGSHKAMKYLGPTAFLLSITLGVTEAAAAAFRGDWRAAGRALVDMTFVGDAIAVAGLAKDAIGAAWDAIAGRAGAIIKGVIAGIRSALPGGAPDPEPTPDDGAEIDLMIWKRFDPLDPSAVEDPDPPVAPVDHGNFETIPGPGPRRPWR